MLITEKDLKTLLVCPRLHNLGGSANNYDLSQKLVRFTLNKLINKQIRDEIKDLDQDLNKIVSEYIYKLYNSEDYDDAYIIRLKKYAFDFIFKYLNIFNIKNYTIINGPSFPIVNVGDHEVRLTIDAIYKPTKRKRHLHAVCFYPTIDDHLISQDITLGMKANYLKKFSSFSISNSDYSSANIHLISISKFDSYRSKTTDFKLLYKHLKYEDINYLDPEPYVNKAIDNIDYNYPMPLCVFKKCQKREQCFNELR